MCSICHAAQKEELDMPGGSRISPRVQAGCPLPEKGAREMRPNSIFQARPRRDRPSVAPFIRLALFTIAIAIFSPKPSNAYSTYSLATLESNGTVVGDCSYRRNSTARH